MKKKFFCEQRLGKLMSSEASLMCREITSQRVMDTKLKKVQNLEY